MPWNASRPREHGNDTLRHPERLLDRLAQSRQGLFLDHEAIDHKLQGVVLVARQLLDGFEVPQLAIDPRLPPALGAPLLLFGPILPLAPPDHRSHEETRLAGMVEKQAISDLPMRARLDGLSALGTLRLAQSRIEKAQMVEDLRRGADRGARIPVDRLLIDADGGRKPFDMFDGGFAHASDELSRVAGKAFDVATLPFAEDRVEREAGFPRPRHAREDDESIAREIDGDVAEIVFVRPDDAEKLSHGFGLGSMSSGREYCPFVH